MRLYLIRHAEVAVRPDKPGNQWHLSPEGRATADALAEAPFWADLRSLHTSPEPKAATTAQRIAARHGLPIRIERDLREIEGRAWVREGYREQVRRYLAGETVDGWEPRDAALRRVRICIDAIVARHQDPQAGIVSHGLALTLYLTGLLDLDADATYELCAGMRFPDVAVLDPDARRLEGEFGARAAAT